MSLPSLLRPWAEAPRAVVVTALVAAALLVVLGLQTPFDIRVHPLANDGLYFEHVVPGALTRLGLVAADLLLALAPIVAVRSTVLGVIVVLPRVAIGALGLWAWPFTGYAGLVAVAVVSLWRHPVVAWILGAVATAAVGVVILHEGKLMIPGGSVEFGPPVVERDQVQLWTTVALYGVGTAVVLLVGVLLRRDAIHAGDVVDLVRRRREVGNQAAALSERSRLARDLHDVVAHHVSLIAVRAETAPYTCPTLAVDAREVLADIARDARRALDELRSVLDVLGRADGTAAGRAPQPSATDIAALVLEAQSATDVVSASLKDLESVQPGPGYVAYRVVQEALTNARRHAGGVPVDVIVHGDGAGGVRVVVENRTTLAGPPEPGRGLTGMRERVEAVGGELEVSAAGGSFVVEARLPAVSAS